MMNNKIKEKYLPIGTVVLLKEAEKRIMIIGFCIIPEDDQDTIYDYIGCLYPEGVLDPKQNLLFNHDQIEKVFYMGLEDEEEQKFKTSLKELIKKAEAADENEETQNINEETTQEEKPQIEVNTENTEKIDSSNIVPNIQDVSNEPVLTKLDSE